MGKKIDWKKHKGIKYSDSGQGFFWIKFPSGLRGKIKTLDEAEVLRHIDKLSEF